MLNVMDEEEVRQGFHTIIRTVSERTHSQAIEGILVSPMRPAGIKLNAGIIHAPRWSQALAGRLGGLWADDFNDTNEPTLPVSRDEIQQMLVELQPAPLLPA